MRIIQLIDTLRSGGAERMAINFAHVLTDEGIANALVVSREDGIQSNRLPQKTELTLLKKRSFYDFLAFIRVIKAIRAFQPDIVHAHSTSIFWALASRIFVGKVILIWHDHYGLSDQLKPGDRKLERILSRWMDGVVVVNKRLKRWIVEETKLDKRKVVMIPNFPHLMGDFNKDRTMGSPVILLQLANFRRQKNHFRSLEAFNWLISEVDFQVELWLAGATDLDPSYSIEVKKMIDNLGIGSQVKILGDGENIEDLLRKAHIGILSSDSEGLPVSLLEYGLAGLPVVATQVGECSEVLQNGRYGKLVSSKDFQTFGKAIKSLIENYSNSAILGNELKFHVEISYGAKGFLNKYLSFFEAIK